MAIPMALTKLLKSKSLIFVLVLGNVALALTIMVQGQIIQGQKNLIRLLFQDSAELTAYKLAAIAKKH
jgi:hypothetical protein